MYTPCEYATSIWASIILMYVHMSSHVQLTIIMYMTICTA